MKTFTITKIAVFSAILSILSTIYIPTLSGVSFTLQTFGVALAGFFLGKKQGVISVFIYIILGAIGLPIFSNSSGGLAHLFGKSGGFIFGFLFLAFFSGFNVKPVFSIILSVLGLAICHLFGILQFSFLTKNSFLTSFISV